MLKETLDKLAKQKGAPCITISLNTHRTHPDCAQDVISLKNLVSEASDRLESEFGKRETTSLIESLNKLASGINERDNLDSLHLFVADGVAKAVRIAYAADAPGVHISDSFAIRPLLMAYNRSEEYLVLVLSQNGVSLFEAMNDGMLGEVYDDDFPFKENPHYETNATRQSDSKAMDNLVLEFLNKVDKAVVSVHADSGLPCVVIATEDNHSRLLQVADRSDIYVGKASINYNATSPHQLASQAWEVMQGLQADHKQQAVEELKQSISQGKVVTDLADIYRAAKEGRGELMIVSNGHTQPARITGDTTFDAVIDAKEPGVVEDIIGLTAWEVVARKGRAVFVDNGQLGELGPVALKVRF